MTYDINWRAERTDEEWAALAESLREARRDCYRRSAESFDRCDTDGFLSQWASEATGRMHEVEAALADDHGLIETDALFTLDGEIASTHHGWNDYGEFWVLRDKAAAAYGRRFFNPSGAKKAETRRRNNRKRGFVLGTIRVRGYVKAFGDQVTLHYATVPYVSDLREDRFEVVTTENEEQ